MAAGLKNWEQGQYEEANLFFKDFLKVESPASDPWIGQLKPVVAKYQADFKLFEGLPNPSQRMAKDALAAAKSKLKSAQGSLKTQSSLKKLIQARIERADAYISQARNPPPKPPPAKTPSSSSEWTEAEKAEVKTEPFRRRAL